MSPPWLADYYYYLAGRCQPRRERWTGSSHRFVPTSDAGRWRSFPVATRFACQWLQLCFDHGRCSHAANMARRLMSVRIRGQVGRRCAASTRALIFASQVDRFIGTQDGRLIQFGQNVTCLIGTDSFGYFRNIGRILLVQEAAASNLGRRTNYSWNPCRAAQRVADSQYANDPDSAKRWTDLSGILTEKLQMVPIGQEMVQVSAQFYLVASLRRRCTEHHKCRPASAKLL